MHPARSGDRNVVGGDRHLPDRGIGFLRRGDRYTKDRWNVSGGSVTPPVTGLVDGDPVTTWKDSSGNGHDASQTGTARPTFKTNIVNGKPVVRFTSAGLSGLNLATPISGTDPWTVFTVFKPSVFTTAAITIAGTGGPAIYYGNPFLYVRGEASYHNINYYGSGFTTAFHVASAQSIDQNTQPIYVDGVSQTVGGAYVAAPGTFSTLGWMPNGSAYSDCDIAEIIFYSGTVAIRAKLLLVLTVLLSTGEIPSPDEAEALLAADDLVGLEAYLIEHGVPVEEARDTLEPMAVGDRANIEKYLGNKYGIAVAGGTAVDPSTVAGLQGWWKADSLATIPFTPQDVAGLKAWWKADAITSPGLIVRQQPGDVAEPKAGEPRAIVDGDGVRTWPDSSSNGYNLIVFNDTLRPTYRTNVINGKPVVRFTGASDGMHALTDIGVPSPNTLICVVNLPVDGRMENGSGGQIFLISGGQLNVYDGNGAIGGPNVLGAFHVLTAVVNGAASHLFVDGVQVATWTTGGLPVGPVNLMNAGDNVNFYAGDMAEFLIYNSALSSTDRQNVEAYLKSKYGTP